MMFIFNQKGLSLIEALVSLASIGLIIAGTVPAVKYMHDLQYVRDIRIVDSHFNRIRQILHHENCDSFIGKNINVLVNRPKEIEDIKVKSDTLYSTDPDKKTLLDGPGDQEPRITLKSMSLKPDTGRGTTAGQEGYYTLILVFKAEKARTSTKSLRLDEDKNDDQEDNKGEIERSLMLYMDVENRIIKNCGFQPMTCKAEVKRVNFRCPSHTTDRIDTIRLPDNIPSGGFHKIEDISNDCVCQKSFYCYAGDWEEYGDCTDKKQ